MAGKNLAVYGEIALGCGTVPNLVIAFALTVKVTSIRPENPLHLGRVVCHLVAERNKLAAGNQIDRHLADRTAC
jgi:hypothetical protein